MLFNNNEHVIGDEIRAKQDEFGSLMQLGQKMYGRQPGQKTEEKINSLGEDRKVVLRGWQVFNREADQLDASNLPNIHRLYPFVVHKYITFGL